MTRTLSCKFRLSALRRPSAQANAPADRRVADEELVHELWTRREALRKHLEEHLQARGVTTVELTRVNVDGGVIAELKFTLERVDEFIPPRDAVPAVVAAVAGVLEDGLASRVSVSASLVGAPTRDASQPWGRIAPILAVIGTGIGVLGFVTFVGGAVVWARLNAAGIPSAPALGVFPNQDLLVIGAETLVPQVLIALGIVAGFTGVHYLARSRKATWTPQQPGDQLIVMSGSIVLALVLMWAFVIVLLPHHVGTFKEILLGIALIVFLVGVAAIIAHHTSRWLYLAVATFLLVATFQGYLAYTRENSDDRVRAAALIRDNKKAIVGLFVAEGSGRVYVARVGNGVDEPITADRSRLVGIAKDQISDLAVGDRRSLVLALEQADALARELCESQPRVTPSSEGTPAPTATPAPVVEDCRTAPPGNPSRHQPRRPEAAPGRGAAGDEPGDA